MCSASAITSRATAEHAKALLDRAVRQVRTRAPRQLSAASTTRRGGFVFQDEYVFVIGLDDGRYRASGSSPNLVGVDVRSVTDAAGKPLFKDMIELARKQVRARWITSGATRRPMRSSRSTR